MAGQFVDISAFQPEQIDWNAYKQWSASGDGVSRVAMRSSYGLITDAHFQEYRAGALAAGIQQIFYYHYAYPQLNTPGSEALYQHGIVGAIRPQDLLVLDFEEEVPRATAQWALSWLQTQTANYGGKSARIYAYEAYIQARLQDTRLEPYALWYALWEFDPNERPPCPAPWKQYEMLQYTDRATNIPGIAGTVDADIFIAGAQPMQAYGPNSGDFNSYFTLNSDGSWTCKEKNTVLLGGNLGLFQTLSVDGQTLPIIGLPLEGEQYHTLSDGYQWSSQQFERGTINFDPSHRIDSQPGLGASYLAHVNPPQTVTVEKIPDAVAANIKTLATPVAQLIAAVQ